MSQQTYDPNSWYKSQLGQSTQSTPYTSTLPYSPSAGQVGPYETSKTLIPYASGLAPASDAYFSNLPYDPKSGQVGPYDIGAAGTGGGGGTGSFLDRFKSPVIDKINQLKAAYQSLSGNTDKTIQDQISRYNTSYDTQAKQLNDAFTAQQGQLGGAYAARGLAQSSFLGDAQGQAQNIYNSNVDAMTQGRSNALADIGKYGAQQHQSISDAMQRYDAMMNGLGQYDTAEATQSGSGQLGLQNLNNSLTDALGTVNNQNAGLGTQADFIAKLQGIAPQSQQGTNQLAEQLQKVVTSGAPAFAKNAIAQGIIKQAQLQDPNAQSYWNNWFQQKLNGQA